MDTLETLKQVASVQYHRTPLVPYFPPVPNPDRGALMENIRAVTPNHMHRLESIEMALCVQNKKRELVTDSQGMKRFESQLRVQKDHLHKMDSISQLEDRQEKKMIALYMEEKAQREEQLEREMEWVKKAAERKREEEREKVKERLIKKQKEDEKRRKRELQNKRFEEDNSESFCGDEDGDSVMLSSFSSAASLLEHVKSLSDWSSDTQQEKSESDKTEMPKLVSDDESKQWGERAGADSHHTSEKPRSSQKHSLTAQKNYSPSKSAQTHSKGLQKYPSKDFKDSNGLLVHSPPLLKTTNKTRERQQKETQLPLQPRTTSQQRGHRRENGPIHSNPRHVKTRKPDTTNHTHLNNSLMKAKGRIQSPPGLQTLNPIFQSSASQDTPPHTSRFGYHKPAIQKIVQPIKQLVVEHKMESRAAHPQRVHVKTSNRRHTAPRRVSSSDALLEEPASGSTSQYHRPHLGNKTLTNTPPKVRKSMGYLGEFDITGHYDVLEARTTANFSKSLAPQHRHESLPAVNGHSGIGSLQMPTFPDSRAVSDVGVQPSRQNGPSLSSNSQPDSFDFSSNPSYETRSEVQEGIGKQKSSKNEAAKHKKPTGGIQNGHLIQTQGPQSRGPAHHQFPYTPRPSSAGGPVIHHPSTRVAMKSGKTVNVKPSQNHHSTSKIQPGFGSSTNPYHSESENSQNTDRVHSVLSNISSTHHSVVSNTSGQQSQSSAFSRRSGVTSSYKTHTEKTSSKPPSHHSRSVHGDSRKNSPSGLPVPRKHYRSTTQSQVEVSNHRSHRRPAPQAPPHRQSSHAPTHDQGALTSYPRFQSRDNHRERLQEARSHKNKQFSVLPGTGQLAQFPKPVTDHKATRNPGVGSLV